MLVRTCLIAALAATALTMLPVASRAADPIHAQGVMGDKGQAGPDGWSWAPVARDDSASKDVKAPGEGAGDKTASSGARPVPDTGKHLSAGADPGTPEATPEAGPAGSSPAAPSK